LPFRHIDAGICAYKKQVTATRDRGAHYRSEGLAADPGVHTKAALRAGATSEELMEAIWVASEMRAGGAYAHSNLMLATLAEEEKK
jgi:alkylhydroperoxidase/carboxymuconolactone decarboxylase family protein YurZ